MLHHLGDIASHGERLVMCCTQSLQGTCPRSEVQNIFTFNVINADFTAKPVTLALTMHVIQRLSLFR